MLSACNMYALLKNIWTQSSILSFAKDGSPHPDHCRAALHCYMVIVAHPPTAFAESVVIGKIFLFNLIEERSREIELRADLLFVIHI